MSADATTTDGFRVGRRVRVTGPNSPNYMPPGGCGILASSLAPEVWRIEMENPIAGYDEVSRHERNLELLPDDAPATPEPDHFADAGKMVEAAPATANDNPWAAVSLGTHPQQATPEPKFRPGDAVDVTDGAYCDRSGVIHSQSRENSTCWHVDLGNNYGVVLVPGHAIEPRIIPLGRIVDPAANHYAILRERGHEPWDVMRASFPADWCLAYNVLTALAYLQRCKLKHPTPDDDIRKAHAHLTEALAILDGKSA